MRRVLRIFLWLVGSCLALVVAAAIGLALLFGSPCDNEVLAELPSPDGRTKAVVFQRDCGATTGFSTQVSLIRTSSRLGDGAGNIFVSDTNRGAAPSGIGGGPELRLAWTADNALEVSHHPAVRIFKAESKRGNVRITYTAAAQAAN